jgi:hypothetical protein
MNNSTAWVLILVVAIAFIVLFYRLSVIEGILCSSSAVRSPFCAGY